MEQLIQLKSISNQSGANWPLNYAWWEVNDYKTNVCLHYHWAPQCNWATQVRCHETQCLVRSYSIIQHCICSLPVNIHRLWHGWPPWAMFTDFESLQWFAIWLIQVDRGHSMSNFYIYHQMLPPGHQSVSSANKSKMAILRRFPQAQRGSCFRLKNV